ncbi:hypothetical protein O9929_10205 [Vibrio lentus]|nr:hypothetical protein [Vibrio lentus]
MIAAAGFAAVMKQTGGVESWFKRFQQALGDNKPFSSIAYAHCWFIGKPISARSLRFQSCKSIYVLAAAYLVSPMATIALVGTMRAYDAGSPALNSTLGPTSGLNADGQHEHRMKP